LSPAERSKLFRCDIQLSEIKAFDVHKFKDGFNLKFMLSSFKTKINCVVGQKLLATLVTASAIKHFERKPAISATKSIEIE
jgi:hypothetical protein